MGTASRALLIIFRVGELACGAIVMGLLGRLFYLMDQAGIIEPNGRLIYAAVVAGVTILQSLIFIIPLPYSYWIWPLDFILFIAWIVAFSLLISLTGGDTCSGWFNDYWGYYWGRWYLVGPVGLDVNRTGCPSWRGTLAFSFIAAFIYLVSGFLGLYWTLEYGDLENRAKTFVK
ncbi:hypothetical protein QBC43DRAFT_346660 [Cladorrhinum sp. PSN259]|nr:hypothetical protein QBC43DRAFT_346660 [Cladorrhinum sp. PSN259]